MAKLSKDIYDKKANWASERMERNKEIKSLTVKQHDALSTIASKRHNLHVSSGGNPSRYDSEGYYNFFGSTFLDGKGKLIEIIEENNLPKFKPYLIIDEFTYLGGDEWNDDEIDGYDENLDSGSEDYDKKYDAYLNIILNNIELLDQSVRDYLAYIDYLYGTNYAPSRGDYYKYIEKDIKMAKGGNIKKTTDGKKGGILYGKSHAQGGIKAVVTDAGNKEVELEGGEAVVKKSALKDKTVKTLTGTNAQILNLINTRAGGNPIYAPSEVKMKNGGRVGSDDFSDIESLISKGIVEIEYEKSTEKHAKEYGLQCKKPLYLKRIYVRKDYRLKGVGKRVLKYLDFIAQKNSNDCIFGYVSNKVIFTKDNRDVNYNDVQLFKFWLHENGYAINDDNNDFHKVISLKMAKGGSDDFKGSTISDKTINEETDFIAEYLEDNGFFIRRGARSRTDFGESNYLYAHNKVDEGGFPMGDGVKIRISDHSVSNFDRMYNEIHVGITDTKESWEKSAFSILMQLQWQYDKNNKYRKEDAVEIKKVTIEIPESQLRINPPYADKILSERISNNGKKLLTVERTYSNSIEKWYHKESGTYYTTIKPNVFDKGGSIDNEDNIKNKWKSVGKMAKGGSIEDNCISFIKNSEAIKNNGYFHYFKNISIYADFGTKVPKVKSFYLCAYNSGGQKNLKVTDTLNLDLINKLQEIIDCEKSICRIVVDEFFRKAKRIESNDLSRMTGENIIVVDRYNIVCDNIKNEFSSGGSITPSAINNMTKAEQKAFYKTKEGKELDKQTHAKWKSLVNMSKGELESFYNSKEGKEAGLSASEAKAEGIDSGRESARWIMKMKDIPYTEWTSNMWIWAKKQISFVSRMKGMRGDLYDDKGNKTRKHLALLIWGHNPKKMAEGGVIPQQGTLFTKDKKNKLDYKKVGNDYVFKVYDVESNPVENYTRHQCKKRNNNEATMDYNQFINYLYSEHYIDDKKMAEGGNVGDSKLLAPNGKPSNLTAEQYKLVRTAAFKKWFGDWENDAENASKVVDDNGEPLVVYHGTPQKEKFYDFKIVEGSDKKSKMQLLFGSHFASKIEDANIYTKTKGNVFEVFLNIRNILDLEEHYEISNPKFNLIYEIIKELKIDKKFKVSLDYTMFTNSGDYGGMSKEIQRVFLTQTMLDSYAPKKVFDVLKNKFDGIRYIPYQRQGFNSITNFSKSFIAFYPSQIKLADGTNTTFDGGNADIRFAEGGVTGDVFSIKDPEQFKQLITLYNKFSEKFDVDNYFVDDSSVVFLRKVKFTDAELKGMAQYIADLSKNQNFSIISDKKPEISNGYFKFFLKERVRYKDGGNVGNDFDYNEDMSNESLMFEEGGNIPSETKTPEQMAKEFLNNLSQDAIEELKSKLKEALSELVVREKNALDVINAEIADLEAKKESLKEDRSDYALRKRSDYYMEIKKRQKALIHQTNRYYSVKNGGSLSTFTDKKGLEHESIPDFTSIGSEDISFDEENILTQTPPQYIPIINEEEFRIKGYLFDAIRYSSDIYLLAVNGYRETISKGWEDTKEHPSDAEQGYVLVTLDQLILINDYYYTKAKATERKKAEETNKRTEESYDRIPRERRENHYAMRYFYEGMPVSVKKKVSKDAWEALTLEQKEAIYKPIKVVQGKRLVSKLEDDRMWASFHNMYERFLNPEAKIKTEKGVKYGHPEVFSYWYAFRDMMKWKLKDIKFQRQFLSDMRKTALETSFGMSNTNELLYDNMGILIKRQNGSNIKPIEIEQIRKGWINVNNVYGGLVSLAKEDAMKISHTGTTLVFASKAAGVYIPTMKTIAVSAKYGDAMFESILAHEVAHWIDNKIGEQKRLRWATDNYEDTAGIIASTFRNKMNKKSDSDYINATKECFARALEQHFSISIFGENATVFPDPLHPDLSMTYFQSENYVNKDVYESAMKPLIDKFFEENKDFFKYGIETNEADANVSKEVAPIITPMEVKTEVVMTEEERLRKEFDDLAKADTMTDAQKATIERMADNLAESLKLKKLKLTNKAMKMFANSPAQLEIRKEIDEISSKIAELEEKADESMSKENLLASLEGAKVAVEFLEGQKKQDMIDYIGGLEILIEIA